jgi:molybdopterin synthase sulfur carrier subunit
VKLFGFFREALGRPELEQRVKRGATVEDLWRDLARNCEGLRERETVRLNAVNLDFAQSDRILNDGDEVAFFPPVSGG